MYVIKNHIENTYTMGTCRWKGASFGDRASKRAVGRRGSPGTIGWCTRVIHKQCLDVRIRPRILAKLMLPIETEDKETMD